jgi:Protein of unknown function (DUF3800)
MYVDESGDPGITGSPTRYFVLSGLVVHESSWRKFVDHIVSFRKTMKSVYNLPIRREIHAAEYINSPVLTLKKHERLAILRNFADEISAFPEISVTNIVIDKSTKPSGYDVFDSAWMTLFQRFENTIQYGNFPGNHKADHGIIFTDNTNGKKLTRIVRKMSVYNPIPNMRQIGPGYRNIPLLRIIEDPHGKDSADSLLVQAADLCAYLLYQHMAPNSYIKKKGAQKYFSRLQNVLNMRASRSNSFGIVML